MTTQEILAILDSTAEKVGDDSQIESLMSDLVTVKNWASEIDLEISTLNDDVSNLNEKNRALQQANNTLYRQISKQVEIMEDANKAVSTVSAINNII